MKDSSQFPEFKENEINLSQNSFIKLYGKNARKEQSMRIDSIYTGNLSTGAMKSMGINKISTKR